MDVDTHECFRVTPDQTLVRLYSKLPSPALRVKGAIYEVSIGVHKKWTGKQLLRTCRDCVVRQSHYPDEEGNPARLCGPCSKKAGSHVVQNPCRDCPEGAKRGAAYPDENGNPDRLCGPCSKKVGSYVVQNPCRDCPEGAKRESHYPDEEGNPKRLCGPCSKKVGSHVVLKPCRDCPEGAKRESHYPDEEGNPDRLCGPCSKKAGSHVVRNPCRDCPEGAKRESHYPDEEGNPYRLCADCAFEAGLKPQATQGASMVACRCWHRLEKVSKAKLTHHRCCMDPTKWTGNEKKGLIPGRHIRPDAYIEPDLPIHLEGETSGPKGAVYLFHGNEWHGYPPGHPKYNDNNHYGDSYKERYHKTLAQEEMYKMEGYRVFVVWEHEYGASEKAKCPVHIRGVVREI
jgi:hypothetical protein